MKKYNTNNPKYGIFMIICLIILISITGCGNNSSVPNDADNKVQDKENNPEQVPTLELDTAYKYTDDAGGTTIKLNSDGTVDSESWGWNAGGTYYKGTYTIDGTKLIITLIAYENLLGEWDDLPAESQEPKIYTITANNTFTILYNGNEQIYTTN